ncbi:ComEA family DNA-binding protein [Salinimicrobium sp. TH3]|uniref:ComEA family DNA-binding protein n=1 Tax=Salinimicrobium sp. TH3 TaxID=2997342 RepID=UPI00227453AE|nr:helix-hairpin-helix domain-containing protein [Salinimicrobium sp. TH3]MCY2687489.1 helix-hairpin-helix domain-containing protein [Salinimicrobium sp. TH3]
MNNWRSHFVFDRSQQNGIFVLVTLIVILQAVYFFYPFSSENPPNPEEEIIANQLQETIDSLKQDAVELDSLSVKSFNPNYISDYKGYMLGMSIAEIDRLHEHREQDHWVNSAEEFQEVTGISDSLLKILSPSFKFPDFRGKTFSENRASKKAFSAPLSKADLNSATAEELQQVNGIGEKLSARIVNYRNSLGGFRAGVQLKDVYGLSPEVVERVLQRFEVPKMAVEKWNLNEVSIIQLTELPFFNYEQARAVVKYREEVGEIKSMEELQQIKNFPFEKLDRIALYLTIDQEN